MDKGKNPIGEYQPVAQTGQLARQEIHPCARMAARRGKPAKLVLAATARINMVLTWMTKYPKPFPSRRRASAERMVSCGPAINTQELCQADTAHKKHGHQDGHDDQGSPGVFRFRTLEKPERRC